MKKIVITVAALVMCLNVAKAQNDSTSNRKLKIDEVNFITSYYHQDGNNSAVTGGIGSEKLDDFGNSIDLQLSRFDKKNNKHTFGVELGIDVYSSAYSDKIDPTTISSASSKDVRISPSLNYLKENAKNKLSKDFESWCKKYKKEPSNDTVYDYFHSYIDSITSSASPVINEKYNNLLNFRT